MCVCTYCTILSFFLYIWKFFITTCWGKKWNKIKQNPLESPVSKIVASSSEERSGQGPLPGPWVCLAARVSHLRCLLFSRSRNHNSQWCCHRCGESPPLHRGWRLLLKVPFPTWESRGMCCVAGHQQRARLKQASAQSFQNWLSFGSIFYNDAKLRVKASLPILGPKCQAYKLIADSCSSPRASFPLTWAHQPPLVIPPPVLPREFIPHRCLLLDCGGS